MIKFQNKLEKNSQEIDTFLDTYLPSSNGLSSRLFQAMRYSSISSGKKNKGLFSFGNWTFY